MHILNCPADRYCDVCVEYARSDSASRRDATRSTAWGLNRKADPCCGTRFRENDRLHITRILNVDCDGWCQPNSFEPPVTSVVVVSFDVE